MKLDMVIEMDQRKQLLLYVLHSTPFDENNYIVTFANLHHNDTHIKV